jgi:hypothetical protein
MKRFGLVLAPFAFVAAAQLSATAATSTLTVALHEQNGSGENGTATFTQMGRDVKVIIALKRTTTPMPQPAYIHDGTCAKLGPVAYPLGNVVNGTSTTSVKDVTIYKLLGAPHAISVHKSAASLDKYVACGSMSVVHITE